MGVDEKEKTILGNCDVKDLTKKEIEIMNSFAKGGSYKEVSEQLGISQNTVKYHIRMLLAKTGFSNTLILIAHAVAIGLIEL